MRRLTICLTVLGCATLPHHALAPAGWPLGFVAGAARDTLVATWNDTARFQPERAYCVRKDSLAADWLPRYRAVFITAIARAGATAPATETSVNAVCGKQVPVLHTHVGYCTPTRWGPDPFSCSMTRTEATQCDPSVNDVASLLLSGAPYNVIQCGRQQFRFYWASDYLWMLAGDTALLHS